MSSVWRAKRCIATQPLFDKILIANRGEIACRVIRTAKKLGIKSVAVYSEADMNSMHVQMADEAYCIGPASSQESYLMMDKIVNVAKISNAKAIHPGYGFLSENAKFARLLEENNITFIGPPAQSIVDMGSKSASKNIMIKAGVPVVPGYHGEEQDASFLKSKADEIGYPVLIKAVLGKGMRIVSSSDEFDEMLQSSRREAIKHFSDDRVLIEKYITKPRHVEVQIFADKLGNAVYLFERDCSVQRRHQKILEEAPGPNIDNELRKSLGEKAVAAAKAVNYVGAGTVEFILDTETNEFYFMEMNTRLQVEHPVTEMITGTDLVHWQIDVAAGNRLPKLQNDLELKGWAFEARIYAENPEKNFMPDTGKLVHMKTPDESAFVRIETGVRQGDEVSVHYDPMISKLVVWNSDRNEALRVLGKALGEFEVVGPQTNIEFLKTLASHPSFIKGDVDTAFIKRHENDLFVDREPVSSILLGQAALFLFASDLKGVNLPEDPHSPWATTGSFRINSDFVKQYEFKERKDDKKAIKVELIVGEKISINFEQKDGSIEKLNATLDGLDGAMLKGTIGDRLIRSNIVRHGDKLSIFFDGFKQELYLPSASFVTSELSLESNVVSPMPCKISHISVKNGDTVKKGTTLMTLEAMKMETDAGKERGNAMAILIVLIAKRAIQNAFTLLQSHVVNSEHQKGLAVIYKLIKDACRAKRRKCDGECPCLGCIKAKTKGPNGEPLCTYSTTHKQSSVDKSRNSMDPETIDSHQMSNDIHFDENAGFKYAKVAELPNDVIEETALHNSAFLVDQNLTQFQSHSVKFADFPIENDLEHHLFHLSYMFLQAIPLSLQDRLNILSGSGISETIALPLKDALFATAAMFSTHIELYPFDDADSEKRLALRIEVARIYASRSTKLLNKSLEKLSLNKIPDVHDREDNTFMPRNLNAQINLPDIIRSMLALATFSYGVGEHDGLTSIHYACQVSEKMGLFQAHADASKADPSVDNIMFSERSKYSLSRPVDYTEEQERYLIWASCLIFDTYCSMETGNSFSIDESNYPDYVRGWPSTIPDIKIDKIHRPTLARNTIFENTPHAYMFDKMSRRCLFSLYPQPSSGTFNYVVWICVIIRRILRVIRSRFPVHASNKAQKVKIDNWWSEKVKEFPPGVAEVFLCPPSVSVNDLHLALVDWHWNLPDEAKAFSSLEDFASRGVQNNLYRQWGLAAPSVEGNLLCLVGFCYLHVKYLGMSIPEDGYILSKNNSETYTSRQILLACLRALVYILKFLGAPYHPLGNADGMPAPVQYWPIQPLEVFIITSSGLMASNANEEDMLETQSYLKKYIFPSFDALGKIWPIANIYKAKLKALATQ